MSPVSSVQEEDFNTVNPRAIWEAEKRLLHMPLSSLEDKAEAANYMIRNRLNLSLSYINEPCIQYATEKYDGDDIIIPFVYENKWYESWVQDVRVFWNRIEYSLDEPTREKHEAFRMACTSSDPFHKKTLYKYGFEADIPVGELEPKEDIAAVNHLYLADSMTGVVFLHEDNSDLYALSVSNTHSVYIMSRYKEDDLLILNEKPVGPDTSLKINFLNGYKVSKKVVDFMYRQLMNNNETIFFDVSDDNPTVKSEKVMTVFAADPPGRMDFIKLMREAVYRFDPEEFELVVSRFRHNLWINTVVKDY